MFADWELVGVPHRVTVGEFATQAQARDFARNTLGKAGIEGWISPL